MDVLGITLTVWNCLVAWVAIVTTYILLDWFRCLAWRKKYNLSGPLPLPIIGTIYKLSNVTKMDEMERRNVEQYGPVSAAVIGYIKSLFVADVDLLKKIFIKDHLQFQNRYSLDGLTDEPMDAALLALKDSEWKRVRSIVTPTFSPGKIKLMTNEINFCADLLVKSLVEKASSHEPVDIRHHVGCYTMDVIAGTAFGIRPETYSNPDQSFVDHASKVFGTSPLNNKMGMLAVFCPNIVRCLKKCFGINVFYPKKSIQFFSEIIDRLLEERKESHQTERVDMLGLLMSAQANEEDDSKQTNKRLSRKELMAMGFLSFIAGYETTAGLLGYIAYVLSTHPEIQDKLIEEIDAKFQSGDVDVKYDDVTEMTYLDMVVCETLRMYPPVVRMNRMTSHDQDVLLDGHWFPRNTNISYSIWMVHHDLGLYEEPDKFKPERFSPEEKQKRDPFIFMPFGHGPRNCIGMRLALLETKIAIVHVLKKFKFVRCSETEEPLELINSTFLQPKRPIKVGIEFRS